MKHFRLIFTLLAVLLAFSCVFFVSCDGDGEVTTEAPAPGTVEPTAAPDDTTASPETTKAPDTTQTPDTTKAPDTTAEVTTEPPHTHSFGAWSTVKAESCTEEGTKERVCSCGQKETETIAKAEHKAGEWIIDVDSTETMEGSKHQACTVCGATLKTESIAVKPHVHAFGAWNTVRIASCTEEGLTERVCSCGTKETQTIEKISHRAGEWIIDKEATASAEGSKHQVCAVCGTTLKTESIPVTPHVPGEWIIDKEATCTEAGSKHRVCTKCGETADTEIIPATGHKEVLDPARDSTCTETGLTEGKHCSVCNAVITAQQTVPVKAHSEVADPEVPATCTETGLGAGSHCSVCNTVIKAQNTIPAKGHTEKVIPAVPATCTETGLAEGKQCSVCKAVTKAQETVPAKGHNEQTNPSCAPTCTASGLTEGKYCSVCSAVIVAQQTVPATGHTDGEWITDKDPTFTETGVKRQICSVCGETIKTETIPVLEPLKADYSVTVTDGSGAPVADVTVTFMSGDKKAGEGKTDKSGKVTVKLVEGDYAVSVDAGSAYYAPDSVQLTVAEPSVEIVIVGYASNPEYVYPDEKTGVYRVTLGSVRVPVEKGVRRFFFFSPSEGAIYKVYTDSDKVEVGYYGGSFYVYNNNTGDIDENGVLTLEVLKSSVGSTIVLGLDSTSSAVTECTLTIERYSDIGTIMEEIPYEMYEYKTPVKTGDVMGSLHYVQITKTLTGGARTEIKVVYNEKDGFYHLNTAEGPVLYVRLKDKTIFQEALLTIVSTSNLGRYIYDADGNFVRKERYNEAIMAYAEAADRNYGVYPLNDDLMYILKGLEDNGWYDPSSPNSIFADDMVAVEPVNGWLFACVYFD